MEYLRPKTLREALTILGKYRSKAKLVAGGTNVIPDLRKGAIKPSILVDISHLNDLSYIKEEDGKIRIGGLTTISELAISKVIHRYAPILSEAAYQFGNPLVRNRATIAGNLADASPAADMAIPLLVLESTIVIHKSGGKPLQIPINQFFFGPHQTVLKSNEIINEIHFPKPNSTTKMGYFKLGRRNSMAISVASGAILMESKKERCKRAQVSLGAVAPTPIRAYRIEEMLTGKDMTEELIETCCTKVADQIQPITDIRASADYRRSMASVILRRLIQKTVSEEENENG